MGLCFVCFFDDDCSALSPFLLLFSDDVFVIVTHELHLFMDLEFLSLA